MLTAGWSVYVSPPCLCPRLDSLRRSGLMHPPTVELVYVSRPLQLLPTHVRIPAGTRPIGLSINTLWSSVENHQKECHKWIFVQFTLSPHKTCVYPMLVMFVILVNVNVTNHCHLVIHCDTLHFVVTEAQATLSI